MKKKITIITLQNVRNYGSVLQALATQVVFNEIGCEVDFINYKKQTIWQQLKNRRKEKGFLFRLIQGIILLPTLLREEVIFVNFIRKYLNQQQKEYRQISDFKDFKITSDIYCTGSDQTWNSGWNNGILPELFLKFVPDDKKKISYAASIGKSKLDDWEVNETKELLSRYGAISVREKSAVDICKSLSIQATQVLDPTLQVSREFWMSIASPRLIKEKYVLVYQLNTNPSFDHYAVEYAKRRGVKLVRFCIRHYQAIRPGKALIIPKPEDFVSAIACADTVITDSFHATAFSCNLHVPMICIYPIEYSSRLSGLLTLLDLEDRHLTDYNDFSFVDRNNIDFRRTDKILDEQRKIGVEFLKKAIED